MMHGQTQIEFISFEVKLAFILLYFIVLVCKYNLAYFHFSDLFVINFPFSTFVICLG
jgi:hypothetical protein